MKRLQIYLFLLFIFMLLSSFGMMWHGKRLVSDITPLGILDLELSSSVERTQQVLSVGQLTDWKQNIYLDFPFIVCYSLFIYLLALWFYKKEFSLMNISVLNGMAVLCAIMAISDCAENFFMLHTIENGATIFKIRWTLFFAILKFLTVGLVILFLVLCGLLNFTKWKMKIPGK